MKKRKSLIALSLGLVIAAGSTFPTLGEIVYVTACVSNCVSTTACGNGVNQDVNLVGNLVYQDEGSFGAYTSAKAGTPDKAVVPGSRYHGNSFSNSTPDLGIVLSPSLAVTGGVYKVYHVYSSTAGNVSTNVIIGFTNVEGCTISWTTTDKFQRKYGQPSPQQWQLLGFLTNNADTSFPRIRLYFVDGVVNAGALQRFMIEQFKFEYYEPCTDVPGVGVTGPLATNIPAVVVTGVSNAATAVTVYQDSGAGMVKIGELTSGIVAGNNTVPVTGLVKGAQVAATQTLLGTEGCKPTMGVRVGGGANPRLRLALSIKENPTATGPVGANGASGATSTIHFIPATNVLAGSCPADGLLTIYPSNDWQTVTVLLGKDTIGDPASASGVATAGSGYYANDSVNIRVYAYRIVPGSGATVYSATPAESAQVTSTDAFVVNWTWAAVAGADGYRVFRQVNYSGGFYEYVDVVGTSYADSNSGWLFWVGDPMPTAVQKMPSIQWNPTVGNPNNIAGEWGILESIAFVSDDETDNGPFDIYIDNLANGTNGVFQDFEGFVAGTGAGVVFNQPSYSGTTSGNILTAPNVAEISNLAADTGTKSIRVRWQFTSGATNLWMRFNTFNTSVMPNPLINLNEPLSFRLLIQPVGATPVPPPPPTLSAAKVGSAVVLDWEGTHRLQAASDVTGTYTNTGVINGPWTNTFTEPAKFFRLRD
ncbi:MAG TPA: hypothetical protein P5038_19410 [Candidatus Paceibacterota bacterium]|nr:hypothetical protein [Candidatus Paceibacterota bacterium]